MTGPVRVTGKYAPGPVQVVPNQSIPPGGGSGNYNVDAPVPIAGIRIGVVAGERLAGFDGVAASVIEGNTLTIRAKLTRRNQFETMAMPIVASASSTTAAGTYTLPAEFVWPVGQKYAEIQVPFTTAAAAGATTTLVVDFAPGEEPSDPSYLVANSDPAFLPTSFSITVTDQTFAAPRFSFASAAQTVNEGDTVPITVSLDNAAFDDVRIRMYTETVSALPFVDYEPIDEELLILEGDTSESFPLVCPQNTNNPPSDPQVRLRLELVSGTATPGDHVSTVVTILDDDAPGVGIPRIEFRRSQVAAYEGAGPVTLTAEARTGTGTLVGFNTRTRIPLNVSGATTTGDFQETWPGVPNTLVFEANEPTATFQVEALADSEPDDGETITYTIQGAPAGQWVVGTRNAVTVVAREEGTEPTELFHEAIASSDGVRVLRQFTVAIDPPALTQDLPVYEVGGQQAQVVGHRRDAAGLWTQAYVYALDDGSASTPQHATLPATELTRVTGAPAPPEIHLEDADMPRVQFTLRYGNGAPGTIFTCATDDPQLTIDWTSPTGLFPQVGADICRERVFVWRPRLTGGSGASALSGPSGEFMGKVELVEQRIAGERDIVLYEGRFYNGAWSANENQRTENSFCDGTINLHSIIGYGPSSGWKMEVFDAHPYQNRDAVGDRAFNLLKFDGHCHEIRAAKSYPFWFILRRVDGSEAADSAARAEHYWEQRHISTAWGALGMDRNGLSCENGDPAINFARAEFVDPLTGRTGFDGLRAIGEGQMYSYEPSKPGYRADWRSGVKGVWGGEDDRLGWYMPHHVRGDGGRSGGVYIYGWHAMVPTFAQWYRTRCESAGTYARNNVAWRDATSDSAPWWWKLAENNGSEWRIGIISNGFDRWATRLHPHFWGPPDELAKIYGSDTAFNALRLAPTTRPWNTAPSGLEDPFAYIVEQYKPHKMSHIARARQVYLDAWIHRRSPVGYREWEELAAWVTRTYPPIRPFQDIINIESFESEHFCPAYTKPFRRVDGQDRGRGYWYKNSSGEGISDANPRHWGWGLMMISGFFSFTTDDIREALRGQGTAQSFGGASFFGELIDFLNHVTMEVGYTFAATNIYDYGSWDDFQTGPTDVATHSGALPGYYSYPDPTPSNPNRRSLAVDPSEPFGVAYKSFMGLFIARAIECYAYQVSPIGIAGNIVETVRWLDNHHEGMRSRGGVVVGQRFNEWTLCGIDPQLYGSAANPALSRYSKAEVRNGDAVWPNLLIGQTVDKGYSGQAFKAAWAAMSAIRHFEDEGYKRIGTYALGVEDRSDEQLWRDFMSEEVGSIETRISSLTGGNRYKGFGEHTWLVALTAHLLNATT